MHPPIDRDPFNRPPVLHRPRHRKHWQAKARPAGPVGPDAKMAAVMCAGLAFFAGLAVLATVLPA